jgi:hypothetical protein
MIRNVACGLKKKEFRHEATKLPRQKSLSIY